MRILCNVEDGGSDRVLKEVYRHAMVDKTSDMDARANDYFENMQHGMQHEIKKAQ